jgi:cholesterol transport system auxiliary component
MVQMKRFILLGLLSLSLGGCGAPVTVKEDQYLSLVPPTAPELSGDAPASGAQHEQDLQVNELAARGFLGGRQIVFRTTADPWQTQRYDQLLWDEPVPRALSRHLAASIRAAGLFRFVLIPADRGNADYLLSGEVERFEHLPTATPPRVAGTLSLTLLRASDRRPLLVRRYDAEEIVAGETPAAMAAAATRLADRLAAAVVADLRAWRAGVSRQPPLPSPPPRGGREQENQQLEIPNPTRLGALLTVPAGAGPAGSGTGAPDPPPRFPPVPGPSRTPRSTPARAGRHRCGRRRRCSGHRD